MEDAMTTRSLAIFGLAVLFTGGCSERIDLQAEKAAVKQTVDQFETMLENDDVSMLESMMAHDNDMVNFGTDASERWVGWDQLKSSVEAQFAAFESTRLTVKDQSIRVHPSGRVAWFSEVVDWAVVSGGKPIEIPGSRLTGVLEKRNDRWVIVQFHASVPVSGQAVQY
jgi:ketosteroid isomerase-like protein